MKKILIGMATILSLALLIACSKDSSGNAAKSLEQVYAYNILWLNTDIVIDFGELEELENLKIEKVINEDREPTENNTSNFGEVGTEFTEYYGQLLVKENDKWRLFVDKATYDNNDGKIEVLGAVVVGYEDELKDKALEKLDEMQFNKLMRDIEAGARIPGATLEIIINDSFKKNGIDDNELKEMFKREIVLNRD